MLTTSLDTDIHPLSVHKGIRLVSIESCGIFRVLTHLKCLGHNYKKGWLWLGLAAHRHFTMFTAELLQGCLKVRILEAGRLALQSV